VHVARLAGVPETVARRAEMLLKSAERQGQATAILPLFAHTETPDETSIETELAQLNPDKMSPREALDALYELRAKLMARREKAG
jgi:DNA mismatch repair protein MutS